MITYGAVNVSDAKSLFAFRVRANIYPLDNARVYQAL